MVQLHFYCGGLGLVTECTRQHVQMPVWIGISGCGGLAVRDAGLHSIWRVRRVQGAPIVFPGFKMALNVLQTQMEWMAGESFGIGPDGTAEEAPGDLSLCLPSINLCSSVCLFLFIAASGIQKQKDHCI